MLIGRDQDLTMLADYYRKATTAPRRNLIRHKIRTVRSEAKDRKLQNLRGLLVLHERQGNSTLADRTRNAIMNHMEKR